VHFRLVVVALRVVDRAHQKLRLGIVGLRLEHLLEFGTRIVQMPLPVQHHGVQVVGVGLVWRHFLQCLDVCQSLVELVLLCLDIGQPCQCIKALLRQHVRLLQAQYFLVSRFGAGKILFGECQVAIGDPDLRIFRRYGQRLFHVRVSGTQIVGGRRYPG
jgi:hypothetical protein